MKGPPFPAHLGKRRLSSTHRDSRPEETPRGAKPRSLTKELAIESVSMLLSAVGVACVVLRLAWAIADPVEPQDFKGLLYVRDILTLLPASLCLYMAYLRWLRKSKAFRPQLFSRRVSTVCRQHPRLVAAILALGMIGACILISVTIYGRRAHIIDEVVYLFQAHTYSKGLLWRQVPPNIAEFFDLPYFVQISNKWYGSFFPGHPLVLALGVLLNAAWVVNPVLSGVLVALTVYAGAKLFDSQTGLLAGLLCLLSPFALFQGASYFSHTTTAVLLTLATMLMLRTTEGGIGLCFSAGVALGLLLLFRPMTSATAVVFATVILGQAAWRMRMARATLLKKTAAISAGFLPFVAILLFYNWILTGDPLRTPHQVAIPDEYIGPGVHMFTNTTINLIGLSVDLVGVPILGLAPMVICFLRGVGPWRFPLAVLFLANGTLYALYPYHGLSYGPRFYFECVPLMLVLSARGLIILSALLVKRRGWDTRKAQAAVAGLLLFTGATSFCGVFPERVYTFYTRAAYLDIGNLVAKSVQQPALVLIEEPVGRPARVIPYIAGFQLHLGDINGKVVYARDLGMKNRVLLAHYQGYSVYRLSLEKREIANYSLP
ncbi:MAG: hypothetical protein JSU86_00105 [Phycisphaerales bacterium]|nr:MAG: hypothetical protein JSU86_00105 [Phycisphaerales bacterium]